MYYALGAFVKPSFGTAGSEARATGKRCPVKYSLILLSALLVAACGGLSKEQQAAAYNTAAEKYDAAIVEPEATYESAIDAATTDDDGLSALMELYSSYAGISRIFADDLAEVVWTSDVKPVVTRLIDCTNDTYLLEIEVLTASNLEEAIDLSDAADAKQKSCDAIVDEVLAALGLERSLD